MNPAQFDFKTSSVEETTNIKGMTVFNIEKVARKLAEQRARRAAAIGGAGGASATSETQNR